MAPKYVDAVSPPETPFSVNEKKDPIPILSADRLSTSDDESEIDVYSNAGANGASWRYKAPALVLILFLTLGSNFAQSGLGPLKSTIRKQVPGVTNARYGTIASSDSLINGILPIISGVLTDYYGPGIVSIVSSTFILIGAIVRAVGGSRESFPIILAGQIIFGMGSTTIETCQSKLYAHWFRGTAAGGAGILGFISGLDIGLGRVFNLMGNLTSVPIAESTGKWYWTFWVGAIMCALTLVINIAYYIVEKRLPPQHQVITGRHIYRAAQQQRNLKNMPAIKPFSREHIKTLTVSLWAIPAAFWVITLSQLLQAGTVGAYTGNLSEVVETTRGTTRLTAGYTSSIGAVIPIVGTPIVGALFDLFGRRMHVVAFTAGLWVLVFSLLAYSDVHPLCPVILGSVALTSNAIPFIASIPLLVPSQACVGTAFGIWKAFNSAGSTIMDVSVGAIQDYTPTGSNQYRNVFFFLIALKGVDVLYGLCYWYIDKRYFGSILTANEKQRVANEREESDEDRRAGLRGPKRSWTLAGFIVAICMITTAYVLYIVYALGT